jgi:hypothetical protein
MGFGNPRQGVFCCGHVLRCERPVLLVCHQGHDWQFMCGSGDHHNTADGHFIHREHLLKSDPSLSELADLPDQWEAERSTPIVPWRRTPLRR